MIGFPYETEKLRKKEFWALQDINFELKRGEFKFRKQRT
jgi:ABC-type polysaccharide/polyol phosphate transport system ATPase subunit